MPHCKAQYGQWVKTTGTGTTQPCAAPVIRSLHPRYIRETTISPVLADPGAIVRPERRRAYQRRQGQERMAVQRGGEPATYLLPGQGGRVPLL
jgi:hypothetical protein